MSPSHGERKRERWRSGRSRPEKIAALIPEIKRGRAFPHQPSEHAGRVRCLYLRANHLNLAALTEVLHELSNERGGPQVGVYFAAPLGSYQQVNTAYRGRGRDVADFRDVTL